MTVRHAFMTVVRCQRSGCSASSSCSRRRRRRRSGMSSSSSRRGTIVAAAEEPHCIHGKALFKHLPRVSLRRS